MANAIYPKWKEAVMQAASNSSLGGTVKAVLIDKGVYTYNAAHEFYSDLSGVVGSASGAFASKTYTSGVFDAADITFTAVSGNSAEAVVIFIDTGSSSTSRLVAFLDTNISGLPVTPNSGDIIVSWNASGIFGL